MRAERERKNRLKEVYRSRDLPDPQWLIPIRDPEKNPSDAKQETLNPSPDLLQALQFAKEELNSIASTLQ